MTTGISTSYLVDQRTYRSSPPPHEAVLDYTRYRGQLIANKGSLVPSASTTQSDVFTWRGHTLEHSFGARALAGERLYEKVRGSTGLAETILEAAGEFDNVSQRVGRLVKSAKLLKKGKVGKAFRAIGSSRDAYKSIADDYLAWQFGIKPTIGSISDSIQYLQEHPQYKRFRSGAMDRMLLEQKVSDGWFKTHTATIKVSVGMRARLVNPNLALADSYGFMNPVKLGWELIPGSFLVDYFIPVGRFLGAFDPLWGREIDLEWMSILSKGQYHNYLKKSWEPEPRYDATYNCVAFDRFAGVRHNYDARDTLQLKLPPISAAGTTVALAVKSFRDLFK